MIISDCKKKGSLFRNADLDAVVNLISRKALHDALTTSSLSAQRELFISK